jgi:AcrR family transcriptional regulator
MFTKTDEALTKRDLQKAETRARILEVARQHFERGGFEATNLRSVASDAGITAGTILLHFTDKRDLLHAALFDDLTLVIDETVAQRSSARLEARLRQLARAFFEHYARRPALSKALLRESLFADSPWRERFTAQVARVHQHIGELVAEAVKEGELLPDTDAALFGAAFFSFYYFALIAWLQGGVSDPQPMFQRLLSEHMRGARPEPRAAAPSSTKKARKKP